MLMLICNAHYERNGMQISIHLMLMLILRVKDNGVNLSYISIHLMLMLISFPLFLKELEMISIHLMLMLISS